MKLKLYHAGTIMSLEEVRDLLYFSTHKRIASRFNDRLISIQLPIDKDGNPTGGWEGIFDHLGGGTYTFDAVGYKMLNKERGLKADKDLCLFLVKNPEVEERSTMKLSKIIEELTEARRGVLLKKANSVVMALESAYEQMSELHTMM